MSVGRMSDLGDGQELATGEVGRQTVATGRFADDSPLETWVVTCDQALRRVDKPREQFGVLRTIGKPFGKLLDDECERAHIKFNHSIADVLFFAKRILGLDDRTRLPDRTEMDIWLVEKPNDQPSGEPDR